MRNLSSAITTYRMMNIMKGLLTTKMHSMTELLDQMNPISRIFYIVPALYLSKIWQAPKSFACLYKLAGILTILQLFCWQQVADGNSPRLPGESLLLPDKCGRIGGAAVETWNGRQTLQCPLSSLLLHGDANCYLLSMLIGLLYQMTSCLPRAHSHGTECGDVTGDGDK